jgi:hypothetical protein
LRIARVPCHRAPPKNEQHQNEEQMTSSLDGRPKVVLATFGTHGDLHPFLALALALKRRSVEPAIAAAAIYRANIESEGIAFHHMRPDLDS